MRMACDAMRGAMHVVCDRSSRDRLSVPPIDRVEVDTVDTVNALPLAPAAYRLPHCDTRQARIGSLIGTKEAADSCQGIVGRAVNGVMRQVACQFHVKRSNIFIAQRG